MPGRAKANMVLSMAIFGTLALFVRNIPLPSAEIALFRAAIGLTVVWLWRTAREGPLRPGDLGRDLPLLVLSGAALGFNWILLFEAYRRTTVAVATLSYYFAPTIVTLASAALFRERLTRRQAACFAGATAGLALVVGGGGLAGDGAPLAGVAFGLAAAALYACVVLMNKGLRRASGVDRTLPQFAAAVLVLLPYAALTGGFHLDAMRSAAGWLCLLAVGAVHTGLAYCLYFSALRALRGQEAAILSYVDPLVAVLVSLVALREPVAPVQLAGGAMILLFTLANELAG